MPICLAELIWSWIHQTDIKADVILLGPIKHDQGFINHNGWTIAYVEIDRVHITGFDCFPPEIIHATDPNFFARLERCLKETIEIVNSPTSDWPIGYNPYSHR